MSTPDPIRMFIGCAPNNEDLESQAVLEYTLRKNTGRRVRITWMQLSRDPESPFYSSGKKGWQTHPWTTPFSGFRWAIPELCGFEGQAIYSDSDIIYSGDIGELWDEPIKTGKVVIAKGGDKKSGQRYCVSKWDCAAVKPYLPSLSQLRADDGSHLRLMNWFAAHQHIVQPFTAEWNCLDGDGFPNLSSPKLKALHYTSVPHQPQLRHALPRLAREGASHWYRGKPQPHWRRDLVDLFDRLLIEATAAGYGIEHYRKPPFGPVDTRVLA